MNYDNKTIAVYVGPLLGLLLGVASFINGFDFEKRCREKRLSIDKFDLIF